MRLGASPLCMTKVSLRVDGWALLLIVEGRMRGCWGRLELNSGQIFLDSCLVGLSKRESRIRFLNLHTCSLLFVIGKEI